MTIVELIERLEEMRETHGDDCEVRLMTQQNWPFENDILGVTCTDDMADTDPDFEFGQDGKEDTDGTEPEQIIYLVEGRQLCYGDKAAWDAVM